ncbi:MAG: PDDEXK nuclease domain-containing protein [Candidatus Woesearchaeota archaeon]
MEKAYNEIKNIIESARKYAYKHINFAMVQSYWQIGRIIVEEEQKGRKRAKYKDYLMKELSERLSRDYGKGFTKSNLFYMKQFYKNFQNFHALRGELSWTHYRLLVRINQKQIRDFYLTEAVDNRWSTRELERQMNSLLFERIALSKDKKKAKRLSLNGQEIRKPEDLIKDPYVLEFLDLKENVMEKDFEKGIVDRLKDFMLELGKGFSFVARQKRISMDEHYYVDFIVKF